jgi:hypothetical protein
MVLVIGLMWLPMNSFAQQLVVGHSPLLETFLQEEPMGSGMYDMHLNVRPLVFRGKFLDARSEVLNSFVRSERSSLHQFSSGHFFDYKKKCLELR